MLSSRPSTKSRRILAPAPPAPPAFPRLARLARAVASVLNPVVPILSVALPGLALAAPRGGDVIDGAAVISKPDAATTLITQSSDRLAINWNRFSIGADEYVRFVQPGAGSLALNRVVGGNPSSILGKLSANGQVFLVNPNGIYFGHGATVDVGGMVASVFDIATDDFMNGDYVFSRGNGLPDGVGVVNDGSLVAADGGYIALLGDRVANNGVISTRMGSVALASGRQITLDLDHRGLVSLAVDEAAVSAIAGIRNSGEIAAVGGRVLMRASVANDLIDTVINNDGAIRANSIVERDGVIYLAASGGDIENSGLLDASAASDSEADGGTVLVHSSENVVNAAGASIRAAGDGSGDGGFVRVIAEDHLQHADGAQIVADSADGRGGFVEVSGHGSLALRGEVKVGAGGHLLIDPTTLTIGAGSNAPVATIGGNFASVGNQFIGLQLDSGADITLVASSSIGATTGSTNIAITSTGSGNLSILIGTLAVGTGSLAAGAGGTCAADGFCVPGTSIAFTPGTVGNINLGNIGFDLAGGLSIAAGTAAGTVTVGNIVAGAPVDLAAGGDVVLSGGVGSSAARVNADVTVNANDDVIVAGDIYLGNNQLTLNGDAIGRATSDAGGVSIRGAANAGVIVNSQGSIAISGHDIFIDGGVGSSLDLNSVTEVHADNDVTLSASGAVTLRAGNPGGTGSDFINNDFDASAIVSAGDEVIVNADDLNLQGGQGIFTATLPLTGKLDTGIDGSDVTITLNGDLTVAGGTVTAQGGTESGASIDLFASASIVAGNNVTIVAGGDIDITGGDATAIANGITGQNVEASALIDAGNNLNLDAGGSLSVTGGNALASAGAQANFSSADPASASATANATLDAGGSIAVSAVGSDLTIQGGSATANATGSAFCTSSCGGLLVNAVASGTADAVVTAGVVSVDGVNGSIAVRAGISTINATGSSSSGTGGGGSTNVVIATADTRSHAELSGGSVTVTGVGGDLTVADGTATENLGSNGFGTALAEASVVTSSGDIAIDVAGSIVDASASFQASGLLSLDAGGDFDAGGVYSAITGIVLGAAGDLAINTDLNQSTEGSSYDIALNGGNVTLGGPTIQARNLAITGSNLTMSSGNITAFEAFQASMSGVISITGSATNIDAPAVFLSAVGDLTLRPNSLIVGSGTVSGVVGDTESVDFMVTQGAVRPTTANPNARLVSGGVLTLENLTLQGAVPYLWLEADTTNLVGPIASSGSDLLVQYSPHTLDASIGLENSAAEGNQQVNYNKAEHFDVLPGTTVIIGSTQHSGDISIGSTSSIDIGAQNLIAVTAQRIDGLENVISSGIVAQLLTRGSVSVEVEPEPFVAPIIRDIEIEELFRIVTSEEEEDRLKRLVSSEEEKPNMCEAS